MAVIGHQQPMHTMDFACYLAELGRARLNGYFLENIPEDDVEDENSNEKESTEYLMNKFIHKCEQHGIVGGAYRVTESGLEGLIAETTFSDLLVMNASASPSDLEEIPPCAFVKEILAAARCPVMIPPAMNLPPEEIIFCYDGSPSAIFAMKQLTYLFPEFSELKATVLQVRKGEMPDAEKKRINSWLSRHFGYTDIVVLNGDPEDELWKFLLYRKNPLVVMGAYGRNLISRLVNRSHADIIIKTIAQPVFITHY